MLPRSCFCLFCLALLFSVEAVAERLFLGMEVSRIERVIEMGYSMDPGAEAEIERLAAAFPGSPVPGLLEAGYLYWMQNYREWDEALSARFEERTEEALEEAKAYLSKHREDPDAQFAVAMVEMMQVIYAVDNRRWWAAFWKSRSSLKVMRKLVEEYPDYHDAKLPLGMANCYLSKTPGYLKPLAFLMRFKGDWDLGIRYMRDVRDGGLFCRVDGGYFLGGLLIELEGDRQGARDEFAKLAERFPENLAFQSMLAEFDRGLGNQDAARERAAAVLEDGRLAQYPAIERRTLTSLLWSSLASQRFELTIATAARAEAFVKAYAWLEGEEAWAEYARAEALLGLGKRAEALAIWEGISEKQNRFAYEGARKRLAEVGKGEG